jgi:hypothetical protein
MAAIETEFSLSKQNSGSTSKNNPLAGRDSRFGNERERERSGGANPRSSTTKVDYLQNNSPSVTPFLVASKNGANAIPSAESLEMYKRLKRLEKFEQ